MNEEKPKTENIKDKFWSDNPLKRDTKKPSRFVRVLKWTGLVFAIAVIGLFTIAAYANSKNTCEYHDFDKGNMLQMVNTLRSQSGKSPLILDSTLNEYAESKINTVKKNDSDLSNDFYDWAKNKNNNSFGSVHAFFSYERVNICNVRKGIENDKQSFSALTDSRYSRVGIATLGDSTFLLLAEILKAEEVKSIETKPTTDNTVADQKKNANVQYINSEIAKLEQSRDFELKAIDGAREWLSRCTPEQYSNIENPSTRYELADQCAKPIKASIDDHFKKIDEINKQIQEWKRKLVN